MARTMEIPKIGLTVSAKKNWLENTDSKKVLEELEGPVRFFKLADLLPNHITK